MAHRQNGRLQPFVVENHDGRYSGGADRRHRADSPGRNGGLCRPELPQSGARQGRADRRASPDAAGMVRRILDRRRKDLDLPVSRMGDRIHGSGRGQRGGGEIRSCGRLQADRRNDRPEHVAADGGGRDGLRPLHGRRHDACQHGQLLCRQCAGHIPLPADLRQCDTQRRRQSGSLRKENRRMVCGIPILGLRFERHPISVHHVRPYVQGRDSVAGREQSREERRSIPHAGKHARKKRTIYRVRSGSRNDPPGQLRDRPVCRRQREQHPCMELAYLGDRAAARRLCPGRNGQRNPLRLSARQHRVVQQRSDRHLSTTRRAGAHHPDGT